MAAAEAEELFDAESLRRLAHCADVDLDVVTSALSGEAARQATDRASDSSSSASEPGRTDPPFGAAGTAATTEILLTSWGTPHIDAALLDAMPRLRLIVHAAGTVKHLASPEAFDHGVRVTSAAEANAVPVAEYTLAAVILGAKRAFAASARYRTGEPAADGTHRDLAGFPWIGTHRLTVGVIGASRIGRRVVRLVRDVLDADVLVYDPFGAGDLTDDPHVRLAELDEVLRASDVVSLHAPLTPLSRGMIDARGLALMRDGAVLINTARGGLVDTGALIAEVVPGRLDAVLDVSDPEPLPSDSVLFRLPNVFLTPHIAGALGNEVQRLGRLAVEEVERYTAGIPLRYEVFPDQLDRLA